MKKKQKLVNLARIQYHFRVTSSEFWALGGGCLDKPTLGFCSSWTSGGTSSPLAAGPTGLGVGLGRHSHLFLNQLDQSIHQIPWIKRCLYTKPNTVRVTTTVTITITVTAHYLQEHQENGKPMVTLPFFDPHDSRLPILKDYFSLLLSLPTTGDRTTFYLG